MYYYVKTSSHHGGITSMAQDQTKTKKQSVSYDKQTETKRLIIFLVLCFGVGWLIEIFGIFPALNSEDADVASQASEMVSQIMLTPALAALVARLATREGLVKSGIQFNLTEHKFLFLFGWFGMTILTGLGAVIYFLIYRSNFDPNMTNFVAVYTEAAQSVGTTVDPVEIVATYKTDLVTKLFTAALLDIVNSTGEEWGFRAYLLPKLFRKIGAIPAIVLSGVIGGIWYAPFVVMGYYYGDGNWGFPVVNILAMCAFSCVTGIIYSYLSLRTGSIFPSIFAHSSVNVMMSQAALFTFDGGNYFIGPSPTGIIAGIPFIIVAAICLYDVYKNPIQVTTKTE
jgi:membrane protease YdiL (CAAX protease family)